MFLGLFENVDSSEKKQAIDSLVRSSSPSQDYLFMMILSISMATLGILVDSIIIVLGSMLIAPILYPVLGLGMGIAILDDDLPLQSGYSLMLSIVVSILFSVLIGMFLVDTSIAELNIVRLIGEVKGYVLYVLIALIAGFAASISLVKPTLSESFPGVAIAASLVPPLALAGVAAAQLNIAMTAQMLTLFSVNVIGIVLASATIFALMNLHVKKHYAERVVEEQKEAIQEENQASS